MSQADEQEPLPPEQEEELLEMLRAALRPAELDAAVQERLLEMALEDPLAAPSDQELVESARLRDALEQGTSHEDQALLAALRSAAQPGEDQAAVDRAVKSALPEARRGNVIYAVFGGASAMLAAAAMLVLMSGTVTQKAAPSAAAEFAKPRSTAPLFSDRFEIQGTTARMDLIASERSRDLRDNRYASWGVR